MSEAMRVGVVGAGIAGLVAARELARNGADVHVFDKGRAPGGRISTRRAGGHVFDHGAQYFTASEEVFRSEVRAWEQEGIVARWNPLVVRVSDGRVVEALDPVERFVGTPTMSSIARHLSVGLDVRSEVLVSSVRSSRQGPEILEEGGGSLGNYDAVIVTAPAPGTVALLPEGPVRERAARVSMVPTWAVMAAFDEPFPVDFDAAFWSPDPLTWVARDTSKPGRPAGHRWVLHASPRWSAENVGLDALEAEDEMLTAFRRFVPAAPEAIFCRGHLWRSAFPGGDVGRPALWDEETRIGAAGDWCLPGARFEAAYLSGRAMAGQVMGRSEESD